MAEQIPAVVQHTAKGEGESNFSAFGILAHFVYSIAKISNPFTGVDFLILGMDIHLTDEHIGIEEQVNDKLQLCLQNEQSKQRIEESVERTLRWAKRGQDAHKNEKQALLEYLNKQ